MLVVDAQVHLWSRPSAQPGGPHHTAFTAETLLDEMGPAGVDRVILVPSRHGGNGVNDVALAAAASHSEKFRVMALLDIGDGDLVRELDKWPHTPGLAGYRLNSGSATKDDYLAGGPADRYFREAARRGVPTMMWLPGSVSYVHDIVDRHPGLPLIIDHFGLPTAVKIDESGRLIDELVRVAKYPNVAVKASALPFHATDVYPYRSVHAAFFRVLEAYGAERVFWGTDLSRLPCSYRQAVTMFTEEMPQLSGAQLDLVMGRALLGWLNWHE